MNNIRKINKTILSWSLILVSLTVFIQPFRTIDSNTHLIGYPISFIRFKGFDIPYNIAELLKPNNFIQTQWRVDLFIINVIMVYILLFCISKIHTKFIKA